MAKSLRRFQGFSFSSTSFVHTGWINLLLASWVGMAGLPCAAALADTNSLPAAISSPPQAPGPSLSGLQSDHDHDHDDSLTPAQIEAFKRANEKTCAELVQQLSTSKDIPLMEACSDFYWHNGMLDSPPGSFNSIIKIAYRMIELEPNEGETYTTAAWLLWSKYVTWKKDPKEMPDGELKAKEAIELIERGAKVLATDPVYFYDAAVTITGLAYFHAHEYRERVIGYFKKADELATAPEEKALKIRARLGLAHFYRKIEKKEDAIRIYRAVLDLDPDNVVAKRELEKLL